MSDKQYNYGIALLRMLMCFEVVLIHGWADKGNSVILAPLSLLKEAAIPVFMFLSFYLTEKLFFIADSNKKWKRIWRLVYPQIGWALFYWIAAIVILREFSISNLLWQIFTGHSPKLNPTMWYQSVLIVLTLSFFIVFRFFRNKAGLILIWTLALLSLVLQYAGYNFLLFDPLRFELKYPLGRLIEMIPYATLGFTIAYYDFFNKLAKDRIKFLILFGVASVILLVSNRFIPAAPGFGYSRASNLLLSFFLVGFACLLPFDGIPQKIRKAIRFVSSFTLGIYCVHRLFFAFFEKLSDSTGFVINTFGLCIIVYAISFWGSFLLSKISKKYLKPMVE